MSVEYDLVVIGGTPAGGYAARMAAELKARVAWVVPETWGEAEAESSGITHYALAHLGQMSQQVHQSQFFLSGQATNPGALSLAGQWPIMGQWIQRVAANWEEQTSPTVLSALGVEVIFSAGQFCRRPRFAFAVSDRLLRARSYLLALESGPVVPEIGGLGSTGFVSVAQVRGWCANQTLPKSVVILGGDPTGIALAQALVRLNTQVTLVVESDRILPYEDAELAFLLQAQLEANR